MPWGKDIFARRNGRCCAPPASGFVAGVLAGRGCVAGVVSGLYVRENPISSGPKGGFGTGAPNGVAAPEAGNNSAAGGALVPMLTLGVPGSGTTAVLLALLMTLNITPGPTLFTERPEVVWGLIASLLIANIVLLLMNVPMVKIFVKVL